MTASLRGDNIHVVYGSGAKRTTAVNGVDIEITHTRSVGIAGESGSGKSTLIRTLVGLQAPTTGQVLWNGSPLTKLPARGQNSRARVVQMVFQDPMSSLNPRMTVGGMLREALQVNDIPGEHGAEVARLLGTVGMEPDVATKYPFQFSGGQRQRIALARALAVRPEMLVCDEATSALDVSVQAAVLNLLRDIRAETGLGLAVVSHNLDVLRYLCDDIIVMRHGIVVERASSEELFAAPKHPYTQSLLNAVPRFSVAPGSLRHSADQQAGVR